MVPEPYSYCPDLTPLRTHHYWCYRAHCRTVPPHDARLVIGAGIDPVHGLRGYDVGGAFFRECQAVSGKFTFTKIDRLQIPNVLVSRGVEQVDARRSSSY